jgi:hypothetical protein
VVKIFDDDSVEMVGPLRSNCRPLHRCGSPDILWPRLCRGDVWRNTSLHILTNTCRLPLHEYVLGQRVCRAEHFIVHKRLPISQVGLEVTALFAPKVFLSSTGPKPSVEPDSDPAMPLSLPPPSNPTPPA